MKGASLRFRLMMVSLVALIPGFLVLAYTQYEVFSARRAEVGEQALRGARLAGAELERVVDGMESLLFTISRAPPLRTLEPEACSAFLTELDDHLAQVASLGAVDASGVVRCTSTALARGINLADRPYFRQALSGRSVAVGVHTVGRMSGLPVLPIALAVPDGGDLAVIIAAIDLRWLGERLRERGLPEGGSITVADRDGVIVAREPFPERFVGTRIPESFMRLVRADRPGVEEIRSQDGTTRVLGYVPARPQLSPLYVSVGLSTEQSSEPIRRTAMAGIMLALLGAITTLLATWVAGDRFFVRPVGRVIDVLRRWRGGDHSARAGFGGGHGEIGRLGDEIDRMMDAIAKAEREKELLIGELLHRVRNTLSTVSALASATLNKPEPARQVLPDYLARVAALANTHEVLTNDNWEGAELDAIVRAVVAPLVPDHEARIEANGPKVHLNSREALAMTLVLHELTTNAIKYGALRPVHGRVLIAWSEGPDGLDLVWREQDGPPVVPPRGAGFGSKLMARVFDEAGSVNIDYEPTGIVCRISLRRGQPSAAAE